jgi:hypothetical protein
MCKYNNYTPLLVQRLAGGKMADGRWPMVDI